MYFDYEEIQFESKYEKCNKISKHKKKLFLTRLPKILLLSFQRNNSFNQTENVCIVNFPEILDIKDYIEKDFRNNKITTYNLSAIINHLSHLNFEHYYSLI